jgi:putative redox protein
LSLKSSANWEKVSYLNPKGLRLTGLLYSSRKKGDVLIVCHGFTGSKEGGGRALEMAEELGKRGYATLLFDFSGNGESEGDFADISLTGQINDLKSSVDFCLGLGFERIIVSGRSFGGTTALCYGGADRRVAGVCTWAAPSEPFDLFNPRRGQPLVEKGGLVPLTGEQGTVYLRESFFTDLRQHDVYGQAALLAPRPLLVVHGSSDSVVPPWNARAIYDAAGEPKEIRIVEGADHRFTGRHLEAWDALFNWLGEHFPQTST